MRKIEHNGFIWLQKNEDKIQVFENGLVICFHENKIKDENFPCLMSAVNHYEKLGFKVADNTPTKTKIDLIKVYLYTKSLHDKLETGNHSHVGPWENRWAWKFIAVKPPMFALGLNPIDAVKGIEAELTSTPKFKPGETIFLGKNITCIAHNIDHDQKVDIDDDLIISEISDTDYIFSLGDDLEIFEDNEDPDSPKILIKEVSKAIEDVDSCAAYVGGRTETLPYKEVI